MLQNFSEFLDIEINEAIADPVALALVDHYAQIPRFLRIKILKQLAHYPKIAEDIAWALVDYIDDLPDKYKRYLGYDLAK